MQNILSDLAETLGAKQDAFQVGNSGILLQNQNLRFYHENFFSSKDFETICKRHNLDGEIHFNSNNTISFIMRMKM